MVLYRGRVICLDCVILNTEAEPSMTSDLSLKWANEGKELA